MEYLNHVQTFHNMMFGLQLWLLLYLLGFVDGVISPTTPTGQTSPSFIPDFNETVISSTPIINDTTQDTTPSDVNDTTTAPGVSDRSPTTSPDVKASTTTGADTSCDVNYTSTSSSLDFVSPYYPENYRSNMYCEYRFTTSSVKKRDVSNYGVQLTFQSFELEDETYCLYDYIEIYDGETTSDPLIGKYCGTHTPPTAEGTKSTMLVIFASDDSYNYKGFSFQYKEIDISYPKCMSKYGNKFTALASVQSIQNSAYPGTYAVNIDEYFLIENSATLILELTNMDIERAKGCIYDRIIIYDGACPSFGILDTHCGTFLKRWELTGTEYLVQFHTDSSVQKTGFRMDVFLGIASTGSPTTTTTTIGPPVEAEILVMDEVLTNYSVENFPSRDLSTPIGTTVDIYLVGINDLDEVQQKLTTTVLIDAKWQDDFLKWETTKQGGVIKLLVPQNDIWKPDLALLNGFESLVQFGDKFMFVVVESNGSCQWRPYQILSSTCNVDMSFYPYDTQSCDLKFSTWSSKADQVITTIGGQGMMKHEYYIENTHWTLLSITQKTETIGNQNVVTFTLSLRRNPSFVIFYIAMPVVMLALLNTFTFVLPPASGEKASYSIVVFLSFVVYVIVTYQKMPENSDKLSLFALYVLNMSFISCLTVIITTFELRMITQDTTSRKLSERAVRFTVTVFMLKQKLMCYSKRDINSYGAYLGIKRSGVVFGDTKLDNWKTFVSALDFTLFWLFLIVTIGITCTFLIYIAIQ